MSDVSASSVGNAIDRDLAVATLRQAIGVESVTGNEAGFAAFLARILTDVGVEDVVERAFLPGRPNVWGVRKGHGGGPTLLLTGHSDVVHVRGWRERWDGTERSDPFGGAIVDNEVWGRGAADLKGGICMILEALRAIEKSGTALAGSVVVAFVGDEESGEPGTGVSAGMKAFVPAIRAGEVPWPDFAIYVEPTRLDVYTAQIGFFIADIEVTGRTAYFGVPELGADALKATHAILAALWSYSAKLEHAGEHPLVGRSFLLVTGIEGGGLIAVPERCRFSLIRKLRPGEDLSAAREALELTVREAVRDPDIKVVFSYPAGRDHELGGVATEIASDHEAVRLLQSAIRNYSPARGHVGGAPFWSEASFLTALGIPTVYFAPGDIRICHSLEERIAIDEYLGGIAALAEFIIRYCGVVD
jgi:acetylornithine deacetylase